MPASTLAFFVYIKQLSEAFSITYIIGALRSGWPCKQFDAQPGTRQAFNARLYVVFSTDEVFSKMEANKQFGGGTAGYYPGGYSYGAGGAAQSGCVRPT